METKSKAQTFVGFVIRSGKYRIGLNSVESLKKAELILVCKSAAENSVKQIKSVAARLHCPLLLSVNKTLEEMTSKPNAKVMAVTDKALAKAILENYEEDFISVD